MRKLASIAAVVAAVFYLDPVSGARRRALLRDQYVSLSRRLARGARVAMRDSRQRLRGLFAAGCHAFNRHEVGDEILRERVRARLGRCVSHPGAIDVEAGDGRVMLSGPVLASEHARLLDEIRAVSGVRTVEDALVVHESAAHIPGLQGGRMRQHRFELMQQNWSPAARLFMGAVGAGLVLYGLRRRGAAAAFGIGSGAALLARVATNVPIKRLANVTGEFSVDVHKGMEVHAPVTQVFETLADFGSFPRFMRNVRSVRVKPDGTSHWIVAGPAGTSVKWDSLTTQWELDRLLAWRSTSDSAVDHSGLIRFEPVRGGNSTRLEVHLSYRPPAGALGHVIARLFGADPRKEINEDLLRLKSFLETGKAARDAAVRAPKAEVPGIRPEGAAGNGGGLRRSFDADLGF